MSSFSGEIPPLYTPSALAPSLRLTHLGRDVSHVGMTHFSREMSQVKMSHFGRDMSHVGVTRGPRDVSHVVMTLVWVEILFLTLISYFVLSHRFPLPYICGMSANYRVASLFDVTILSCIVWANLYVAGFIVTP